MRLQHPQRLVEHARGAGEQVRRVGIAGLASRINGLAGGLGERGVGLLRALMLDRDDGPAIVEAARKRAPEGLLLNAPRPNLLRFMPALNSSREEVDEGMAVLARVMAALGQGIRA